MLEVEVPAGSSRTAVDVDGDDLTLSLNLQRSSMPTRPATRGSIASFSFGALSARGVLAFTYHRLRRPKSKLTTSFPWLQIGTGRRLQLAPAPKELLWRFRVLDFANVKESRLGCPDRVGVFVISDLFVGW